MAQTNPKVVPFDSKGISAFAKNANAVQNRAISGCRDVYSGCITKIHRDFFDKVDDELFTLSDKAESSTLQSVYFDAMRFIRKERDRLQTKFVDNALEKYDEFWDNPERSYQDELPQELDEESFSLVENEDLEEDLAITTMVDKGQKLFHTDLYALERRFGALLGIEMIDRDANPVGPYNVCYGFENVIKPLDIELEIKLVVYKLYDRVVLSQLGEMYGELNAVLVKNGVLTKLPRQTRRRGVSTLDTTGKNGLSTGDQLDSEVDESSGFTGGQQSIPESAADVQMFHSLQSLLTGWRTQMQMGSPFQSPVYTGAAFETHDVLNALSGLQHIGAGQNVPTFQTGHELKLFVSKELNDLHNGEGNRPIGALEEDVIDMVGMIFDFILDDKDLPDPIKGLISRLQIPVVKAAMLEKSFFARKQHPVREFLNSLARAGVGLDNQGCETSPIYMEIKSIVGRVLKDFDQDISLFSDLLNDFTAFMEKDDQRSRIIEERTRQVTESKEQLQIAKSKVAFEIAARMQGKELPVIVRSFLDDIWKDVLLLAYLRKDKESKGWNKSLQVVNRVVTSVMVPANAQARQVILQDIPRLIKDIRVGLENISFEPHKMSVLFKDLEVCHVAALSATAKASSEQCVSQPVTCVEPEQVAEEKLDLSTSVRDPAMAAEIESLAGTLADLDESLFETGAENTKVSEIPRTDRVIQEAYPEEPEPKALRDEFVDQAEALEVGQWLSFKNEQSDVSRVKLSWKSPITSLCVFVNKKGVKVTEITIQDLASELRDGAAVVLENPSVPVMDRALSAMMKTFNRPETHVEGLPA